jgi:isopentenyl diphosphate isomerase/L-lactate dehydrogenase-like FMN-dependent dehydrogenase
MAGPLLSVRDAEQAAAGVLPRDVWDFIAGGSEAEVTLAANRAALDAVFLTPRVLAGITACDPGTMLAGCRSALPVAVAPHVLPAADPSRRGDRAGQGGPRGRHPAGLVHDEQLPA